MMRYVVTGGAGFIGSNIVRHLVEQGEDVIVIDNLATGKEDNLRDVKGKIKFIKKDVCDIQTEDFKGVDFVLHQAAIPSVARSVRDPLASNKANVEGTLKVLIAAKDAGVKRVVYAASSSAYGDTPTLPKKEDMPPNPLSPYALTKLTGEYYCKIFYKLFGLETVILRYFNVFGPYQDPTSEYAAVIPKFITAVLKGEQPVIFGDGTQSRDFTFISNVVKANILACTAKDAAGKVINVACGARIDLNELLKLINKILGRNIQPRYSEGRKGDVKHSLADISLAKDVLGYKPEIGFEEGLRKTIEWFEK